MQLYITSLFRYIINTGTIYQVALWIKHCWGDQNKERWVGHRTQVETCQMRTKSWLEKFYRKRSFGSPTHRWEY